MTEERCCKCDSPTGKAGKADDSLYTDDDRGPFCEECWDAMTDKPPVVWVYDDLDCGPVALSSREGLLPTADVAAYIDADVVRELVEAGEKASTNCYHNPSEPLVFRGVTMHMVPASMMDAIRTALAKVKEATP